MLQIRLNKPPNEGGGAQPDTVTVACPDHLVLADLPVAKSLGSPIASAPLKIVGRKSRRQLGERVHICTQCDMPIAVYGRLSPCEHAFCLDCARSDSLCFLCEERIQKIQTIKMMEGLLVCAFPRCFKTFVKKSDLESHIRGNHMDRNHQDAENDGNDSEALSSRKPTASESTVQGPGRQLISHGSSNLQGYDRGEAHRLQPPPRNFMQPKPMQSLPGQSPSRFSDQQLDNNPPPGFDRPIVPSRYGGDHQGGIRQDSSKIGGVPESGFPEYPTMQVHQHTNFAMPPPAIPPQFGYNLVTEGGVQQFYGGGGGGSYEMGRPEMNQEQGSMLGFPPGPSGPWSMSPAVDLQGRGGIFQGGSAGGSGVPPSNMVMLPPAVNKGSESGIQGGSAMEFHGGGNGGILLNQQSHSQLPPPPPPPYLSHQVKQGNFYSNEIFAPSPTGNLHVGGARTALFNYLFARSRGGKLILRIEDTDLERSTKESEEAVLRDLSWLGLDWDEGPDIGGNYGPYRQSERNPLYKQHAEQLLQSGHAYLCFCSNEELEEMKENAKLKQLPPVYSGKWANATEEEVKEELSRGTPYTYRFRVPKEGSLKINDLIRGEVSWKLDTLGDFVIMRSNGQPVYNFCVTVDDATMAVSHVIRAEEHLPNTLRQALLYKALDFPMPYFAHVSLILAPDRSKLSKRHGATSVGQFREMGYLPQAMVNYLALLGWGDGTENEFYTIENLVQKFTLERINKSGAIFDNTKLRWMNGQHLRSLPSIELAKLIGERWKSSGILKESQGPFVDDALQLLKDGIDLVTEADNALSNLLSYPLYTTLSSAECKDIIEGGLSEVAASLCAAYDRGELVEALKEGSIGWKKWVKAFGKSVNRKGKSLFMPLRVLLTGGVQGPDMGSTVVLLYNAEALGAVAPGTEFVTLNQRFELLKEVDWTSFQSNNQAVLESVVN